MPGWVLKIGLALLALIPSFFKKSDAEQGKAQGMKDQALAEMTVNAQKQDTIDALPYPDDAAANDSLRNNRF